MKRLKVGFNINDRFTEKKKKINEFKICYYSPEDLGPETKRRCPRTKQRCTENIYRNKKE